MYGIPVLVLVSTNTKAPMYNVTASMKERGTKIKEEFKRTNTEGKNYQVGWSGHWSGHLQITEPIKSFYTCISIGCFVY